MNDTVWCKLGVSNHGVGVFAIRDIPKGTRLTDYEISNINEVKPYSMNEEEFMKLLPGIRSLILDRMLFNKGDKIFNFISPNCDQILRSFMNHSDDPNSNGVIALRDINKGEEVTENYFDINKAHHHLTESHLNGIL